MFRRIEKERKYKVMGDCAVLALQHALGMAYEEAAEIVWPEILQAPASDPRAKWLTGGVSWPEFVKRCKAAFPGADEARRRRETLADFAAKSQGPCVAATMHVGEDGTIYGHCAAVKGGDWFDLDPSSGGYSVIRVLSF